MARATTTQEDIHFAEELQKNTGFGLIAESIQADYSFVLEWVAENFPPEDVFPEDVLESWAEEHGYHAARWGGDYESQSSMIKRWIERLLFWNPTNKGINREMALVCIRLVIDRLEEAKLAEGDTTTWAAIHHSQQSLEDVYKLVEGDQR